MRLARIIWISALSIFCGILFASIGRAATEHQPKLIVIIDNLGAQQQPGLRIANLPAAVACSVVPHARFSAKLAQSCHEQNKIVILNTPMQALNGYPLGPGGLYSGMSKADFLKMLDGNLASVPYVQGLDNQMGSQLTAQPQEMTWLLESLKSRGLFFVDNLTSPHSVVGKLAKENNVPLLKRDVFLDNVRTPAALQHQLNNAIQIAKHHGLAVVVAHAYPSTIDFLASALPHLDEQGVQLVSIAHVLNLPERKVVAVTEQPKPEVKKEEPAPPIPPVAPKPEPKLEQKPEQKPVEPTKPQQPVAKQPVAEVVPPVKPEPIKQLKIDIALPPETQTVNVPVEKKIKATDLVKAEQAKLSVSVPTVTEKKKVLVETKPEPVEEKKPSWFQRFFHHEAKKETVTDKPKEDVKALATKHEQEKANEATKKTIAAVTKGKTPPAKIEKAAEIKPEEPPKVSMMQKVKAKICDHYGHFCGEQKHKATIDVMGDVPYKDSFVQLQGKLVWPTTGTIVTQFGTDLGSNNLRYNGVLIEADSGQPVRAIYQGRVVFANWLHGLGLLLIIDHGDGYMSLYGHNQAIYKKVGDLVKPHELIAAVGNSGEPGPTGLYFEIRHDGVPINPENWCR